MGQRTQILIIKKHNNGKQTGHVLHRQWGFGRQMYLALMDLFISDYFKDTFPKDYSFDKDVMPFSVFPGNSLEYNCENGSMPEGYLENLDLNDIEAVRGVFERCDNNNGGLVIQMTEGNPSYKGAEFKIAFMLGEEDSYTYDEENGVRHLIEEPFSRYLTPMEYGEMNGGSNCSDVTFVKLFNDFCDYFEIKRVGQDCKKF